MSAALTDIEVKQYRECLLATATSLFGEGSKTLEICVNNVINNSRFIKWTGSSKKEQHHFGKHGLLKHTYEVVNLGLAILNTYQNKFGMDKVDELKKQYFVSALFHDYGKLFDYEIDSEYDGVIVWKNTTHKKRVYHITRSALEFSFLSRGKLDHDFVEDVIHNILAHHGQREWGSPVSPNT